MNFLASLSFVPCNKNESKRTSSFCSGLTSDSDNGPSHQSLQLNITSLFPIAWTNLFFCVKYYISQASAECLAIAKSVSLLHQTKLWIPNTKPFLLAPYKYCEKGMLFGGTFNCKTLRDVKKTLPNSELVCTGNRQNLIPFPSTCHRENTVTSILITKPKIVTRNKTLEAILILAKS